MEFEFGSNSDALIEMLPAYIDTKTDEPFNGYCLQIHKRTAENIKYIVKYVCDSIPGEEISNPLYEKVLYKTCAPTLKEALNEMLLILAKTLVEEKIK